MENGIKTQVTLKALQSRLEKEKAEMGVLNQQRTEIEKKLKDSRGKLQAIQRQIKELTVEDLLMSEHAIIQFQRRVELLNPDEVIERVITEELKKMHKILGTGEFPIGIKEHTAIIKNGVVVTIK